MLGLDREQRKEAVTGEQVQRDDRRVGRIVTVNAPNAPCMQIQASVSSAQRALMRPSLLRAACSAIARRTMTRTPIAVAA